MMDESTKGVLAGWIRHLLTLAAGATGLSFLDDPTIAAGLLTLVMGAVGFGWSYYKNKQQASK